MAGRTRRVFLTGSADETIELGSRLAAEIVPPRWILLSGELGSGKTTLTKGIIRGLGVAAVEDVLSPSFSLIHEYEGHPKVYHIDLYRLDRVPELETLGLDDLIEERAVVIIEWGEKFAERLPRPRSEIHITYLDGNERRVEVVDSL